MIKWDFMGIHPLVNIQKAVEHGHRNSEFSLWKMVDFSSSLCKCLPEGMWNWEEFASWKGSFFFLFEPPIRFGVRCDPVLGEIWECHEATNLAHPHGPTISPLGVNGHYIRYHHHINMNGLLIEQRRKPQFFLKIFILGLKYDDLAEVKSRAGGSSAQAFAEGDWKPGLVEAPRNPKSIEKRFLPHSLFQR